MKRWFALRSAFCFASVAAAQSSAILRGRVTDASGAAIAEAKIKLTLVTTGVVREIVTDTGGAYEFSQLQPGRYTLEASADGFQTQRGERPSICSFRRRRTWTLRLACRRRSNRWS